MKYTSNSSEETKKIGRQIAATLTGGDIILLYGDLGAGKTTIMKGIAEYFGISEDKITSPTFTLMNVYEIENYFIRRNLGEGGRITNLVHIDTYRLENEQQLVEIGVEDYLGDESCLTFIEWPEKIENLLSLKKTRQITLKHIDENKREIVSSS